MRPRATEGLSGWITISLPALQLEDFWKNQFSCLESRPVHMHGNHCSALRHATKTSGAAQAGQASEAYAIIASGFGKLQDAIATGRGEV